LTRAAPASACAGNVFAAGRRRKRARSIANECGGVSHAGELRSLRHAVAAFPAGLRIRGRAPVRGPARHHGPRAAGAPVKNPAGAGSFGTGTRRTG
jgi:hypothetical protein